MSRSEKLIKHLLSFPPTMRFSEVRTILEAHGYTLDRVKGSHHMFRKPGAPHIDVPTKNGRDVKTVYLKDIAAKLGLEE